MICIAAMAEPSWLGGGRGAAQHFHVRRRLIMMVMMVVVSATAGTAATSSTRVMIAHVEVATLGVQSSKR